jgi:hypothetical protein
VKNSSGSFAENSAPFGRSEGFVADDPRWLGITNRERIRWTLLKTFVARSNIFIFQSKIWLELTPSWSANSQTVRSSLIVLSATSALNAALCFFRVSFLSCSRAIRRFLTAGFHLSHLSHFRGPAHRDAGAPERGERGCVDALASVDCPEVHDLADHLVLVGNAAATRWSGCGKGTMWPAERGDSARLSDAG